MHCARTNVGRCALEVHDGEAKTNEQSSAPADSARADEDIEFVDTAGAWLHNAEGYPDADRLPESDGMTEDAPDQVASSPTTEQEYPAEGVPAPPAQTRPIPKSSGPPQAEFLSILGEMGSHLDELRRRAVICFAMFVPCFALGLYLYQDLWRIIILPLNRAVPHLSRFQALGPSDGLVMAMRIAFAFAIFLCLPVWVTQVWNFIAPGLTAKERRWLYLALGSGGVLFAIGAVLAYLVAIPYALEYLLPFNQSMAGWENSFTGTGYVDFIITCCAGFGFAFELPLVMLVLGWLGILTPEALRSWWRVIVLGIFILAAVMTPPDPFTQMLLAIPLLVLFLLGYLLVKWTHRSR